MTRPARVLAALAAAGTLTLTGCHGEPPTTAPSPTRSTPTTTSPSASPTPGTIRLSAADGSDVAVHWVDAPTGSAAPGSDYAVISTLTMPPECGEQLVPRVLLADAAWFVGIRPAALCAWQGESVLPAGYGVGILPSGASDVTSWPSTASLVPGDDPRQVTSSTADGDTVVWSETASTGLDVDGWRVFAASRTDGVPHLVARAEELTGGKDLPFYESTYAISGTDVYWSSAPPEGPDANAPVVVSKSLSGHGTITVLAEDCDQPVTTDHGVVVRTISMASTIGQDAYGKPEPQQNMTADGLALVTADGLEPLLHIESDDPLPFGVHVDALAASGSRVAFAVGASEYLLDLDTNEVTGFKVGGVPVPGQGEAVVSAPVVTSTSAVTAELMAWSYGNGAASGTEPVSVYRFDSGVLKRVDVPRNGGTVWAVGDTVAWDASDGTYAFETVTSWR